MPRLAVFRVVAALAVLVTLLPSAAARAEVSLNIGSGDSQTDLPVDYKPGIAAYVEREYGVPAEDIAGIQLLAIHGGNPDDDVITQYHAVVRFHRRPGSIVVVLRRDGSPVTAFEQK